MEYTLNETIEFAGEWWLPPSDESPPPERKPGVLTWGENQATLNLFSPLTPTRGALIAGQERPYPAVHGVSTRSQLVTVLEGQSYSSGFNFGTAGLRESERVVSSWVIIGAHVDQTTRYTELRVRVPGLHFWLGRGGITSTFLPKQDASPATAAYTVSTLPNEVVQIESLRLTLSFEIDRSFAGDSATTIHVESFGWIRITSHDSMSLEWLLDQFGIVSTLLSLIAGAPMGPDRIVAKTADGVTIHLLVALRDRQICQVLNFHKFFLTRPETEKDLSNLVGQWFEIYGSIGLTSQLARGVLSSSDLWLHVEFLTLMQALEGFHRATMDGLYLPKGDYEEYKQALGNSIPQSAPKGLRDALRARIRYGNEKSLRKRLDELAHRLTPEVKRLLLAGEDKIPSSWVDTRNHYTHWDGDSDSNVLTGIEMHRASVRMRLLLRVLYLDLVGVSPQAVLKALSGANDECQYLLQLNATLHRQRNPGSQAGTLMTISVNDPQNLEADPD